LNLLRNSVCGFQFSDGTAVALRLLRIQQLKTIA
jgi:hypothetical protein